jgi:trigger factor
LDIEAIEMPEEGSLCFEMETEIEPEFELPELEGIAVSKSAVSVEDKDVEATIKSMLAREGVYEPISKGSAEKGDQIVGDLWLKVGDEEITRRDGMALMAGPSELALMTVELNDLCESFVGAKAPSQVTAKVTVGDKHAKEEARGKEGVAGMDIKEIKRLKIPPLTDEWLKKAGWKNQDEFRSVIKENLQRRVDDQVSDGMRMQIREYLLSKTTLELPENLSAGQIQQAQNRRIVELMQMGIPEPQARTAVSSKSEETTKKALDDTKAFFILRRIGDYYGIEVDEGEINGQIAVMARNYGMRPEKMRQQLSESGQLTTMNNQIREVKVLDKLLSQAKISEAKPEKKVAKSGEAPKAQAKKKKKAPDK